MDYEAMKNLPLSEGLKDMVTELNAHLHLLDEHLVLIQKAANVLEKHAKTIEALGNALLTSNIRIMHLEDAAAKHEVAIKLLLDAVYPNN